MFFNQFIALKFVINFHKIIFIKKFIFNTITDHFTQFKAPILFSKLSPRFLLL